MQQNVNRNHDGPVCNSPHLHRQSECNSLTDSGNRICFSEFRLEGCQSGQGFASKDA